MKAKFRASALLYPTHQSRIDYIRDHYKSTAFDVIKARYLDTTNPYLTPEEVLKDLNNMYSEFDAYEAADARLHNPDFNITTETFEEFLAKYIATITPLQLREQQQISNLTRTITFKLRKQITNRIKPISFQAYVQQLRQCDLNMRLANKELKRSNSYQAINNVSDSIDGSQLNRNSRSGSSKRGYYGANQHSEEFLDQLRLKGKCFRCQ